MKLISVMTSCYNEEENIEQVYERVKEVFKTLPHYRYEHVFIDNASTDRTVPILKGIAKHDPNIKIIVNSRNFGWIRSPFHALKQCQGDAVITMVADLQDPPEMIKDFIKKWEEGFKIVIGVKKQSKENPLMFAIRKFFYYLLCKLSEVELIPNFNGFGLYDKKIIEILRTIDDPYPYIRGLISYIGFDIAKIEYVQQKRAKGRTTSNLYSLYDAAMLGITNHSKVPLRLATMLGFFLAAISVFIAFGYFIYKLLFWNSFNLGMAPLIIGFFLFASIQLFFIGILGEYIGAIHTQVLKRPLVIEKERINF